MMVAGMKRCLLKVIRACRPHSLLARIRDCNWHRMLVSFWASLSYIGFGATVMVFGPTLLDVAHHLSVGVGTVSLMFACRAVGAVTGSVTTGVILDKLSEFPYTTISIILASNIAINVLLPVSVHIAMFAVLMFFNGVATGSLSNGVQVVLLRQWGNKSGPCMQVLHFCYAFGAFTAPLIAKPFISHNVQDSIDSTCQISNQSGFMVNEPESDAETSGDCFTATFDMLNCSLPLNETFSKSDSKFAWAFWITSACLILPLFAFIYFLIKYEMLEKYCNSCLRKESLKLINKNDEVANKEGDDTKDGSHQNQLQPRGYRVIILTLLFFFMFMYIGLETIFGSLIFTVAVTGELCFSKSSAALLQSVFWGAFTFMRFLSVSLALLKVPASVMLIGNLSGSLLASIIMVFYPHNTVAIWIGSAVLGMSYASIYPTAMTWMSENTPVSGSSTAVLVAGGVLAISLATVFGYLVEHVTPDVLFYGTFMGVIVLSLLMAVLLMVVFCLRKGKFISKHDKYRSLD